MLLIELVVHNFGVYAGRHVVPLAPPSPSAPVILVGGLNGAGKTTFLDALQLALYGHRARTSNRGQLGYEDYLRHCISRAVPAAEGAAVALTFQVEREGRTVEYRIRRQWAEVGARVRERLDVWCDDVVDPILAENWADHIEELIPLEISALFFFDGEKVEALADPTRAQAVVRSAVHSLLGVNTIDRLAADLVALQRRQRSARADDALDARITEYEALCAAAADSRADALQRLGQERIRLDGAERALERAEAEFAAAGGELLSRHGELEAELARATAEVDRLHEELRGEAAGALPFGLVPRLVGTLRAQAAAEQQARQQRDLAELLTHRDSEVLDTVAGELPAAALARLRDALARDRAERATPPEVAPYLDLDADGMRSLDLLGEEVDRAQGRARRLLEQLDAVTSRRTDVERQLAATPAEDGIAAQLAARDAARDVVLELRGRCDAIEEERNRWSATCDAARQKLDDALRRRVEIALASEDVARLVEHAERARATLADYRRRLLERHIGKLEAAVLDSFTRLMRKQGLVRDLRIDVEAFTLHIFDADGAELRPARLSAGERQLLAVALLWGLARVAGNRLPTVIDTPLGRLDSRHRRHLVERYFPHASRQVLLLSTDEEIDDDLRELLLPHVGHSYLITYDDATQSSRIEPGYFDTEVGSVGHVA